MWVFTQLKQSQCCWLVWSQRQLLPVIVTGEVGKRANQGSKLLIGWQSLSPKHVRKVLSGSQVYQGGFSSVELISKSAGFHSSA
jgi:hypothetical protein